MIIYVSSCDLSVRSAHRVNITFMCSSFSELGLDVILLAFHKGLRSRFSFEDLELEFGRLSRFRLISFPFCGSRLVRLFYSLILFPIFAFYFKKKGSQIYSRNLYSSLLLAIFSVRHYFEIHGLEKRYDLKLALFYVLRKSNIKIVAISEALKNRILNLIRIDKRRVLVAHDGARPMNLYASPKQLPEFLNFADRFNSCCVYAGSDCLGKGVDVLLSASLLAPDLGFIIIGSVTRNNLHEFTNCLFLGQIPHQEVLAILSYADVCVLPNERIIITEDGNNIGDFTSPIKLFEYMALNKKIVASRLPNLLEVGSGVCGFYWFEPGDPSDLVSKVREANLNDVVETEAHFSEFYTWKKRAINIIHF